MLQCIANFWWNVSWIYCVWIWLQLGWSNISIIPNHAIYYRIFGEVWGTCYCEVFPDLFIVYVAVWLLFKFIHIDVFGITVYLKRKYCKISLCSHQRHTEVCCNVSPDIIVPSPDISIRFIWINVPIIFCDCYTLFAINMSNYTHASY